MCKYDNECDHPRWSFYGTVNLFNAEGDLYFYVDEWGEWNYCFRYGPEGEYSSMNMRPVPYEYHESMDREAVIQSANNRVRLWGYFAEFLANSRSVGKMGAVNINSQHQWREFHSK